MVVLAAVSRETLPNYPNYTRANTLQAKKQQEKLLDHVQFAMNLEYTLTSHFMYSGNSEYQSKCVPTTRMAIAGGEAIGTFVYHLTKLKRLILSSRKTGIVLKYGKIGKWEING